MIDLGDENTNSSWINDNVDEPPFKHQKLDNPKHKVIEYDHIISVNSFTFPLNNINDFSKPIVDHHKIETATLKSFDLFISSHEKTTIKLPSHDFQKGWLYNSIIDCYFYKLLNKRKGIEFVNSAVLYCIYNGILNLIFPVLFL